MLGRLKRLYYGWQVARKLDVVMNCEATGQTFPLLELIEEISDITEIGSIKEEEEIEAIEKLIEVSNKKLSFTQAEGIIKEFPIISLLFLIWKRYGAINSALTYYAIAYYNAPSKEVAEEIGIMYCMTYLELTINPVLPSSDRFTALVIPSGKQDEIFIKVANKDYGYQFNSPRAMPSVVAEITEKYFGLN